MAQNVYRQLASFLSNQRVSQKELLKWFFLVIQRKDKERRKEKERQKKTFKTRLRETEIDFLEHNSTVKKIAF